MRGIRGIKSKLCKHSLPQNTQLARALSPYVLLVQRYPGETRMSRLPAAALLALLCETLTGDGLQTKDQSRRRTRGRTVIIMQCHAKQSQDNSPHSGLHHNGMRVEPKHSRPSGRWSVASRREIDYTLVHLLSRSWVVIHSDLVLWAISDRINVCMFIQCTPPWTHEHLHACYIQMSEDTFAADLVGFSSFSPNNPKWNRKKNAGQRRE